MDVGSALNDVETDAGGLGEANEARTRQKGKRRAKRVVLRSGGRKGIVVRRLMGKPKEECKMVQPRDSEEKERHR